MNLRERTIMLLADNYTTYYTTYTVYHYLYIYNSQLHGV